MLPIDRQISKHTLVYHIYSWDIFIQHHQLNEMKNVVRNSSEGVRTVTQKFSCWIYRWIHCAGSYIQCKKPIFVTSTVKSDNQIVILNYCVNTDNYVPKTKRCFHNGKPANLTVVSNTWSFQNLFLSYISTNWWNNTFLYCILQFSSVAYSKFSLLYSFVHTVCTVYTLGSFDTRL